MTKPTWTNDRVKLRELLPFDDNPRMSSGKQAERITKSVDRFGQVHTVAIGPRGEVYDGHQRLAALKAKHGADYEIDVRRASRELTDDERKRLVIALHTGATGQYDFDALANWDSALLIDEGMDADLLKVLDLERAAVAEMLKAEKEIDEFKEYDESAADEVEFLTCPHCGKTFPK